jgi:hypothetical protein
MATEPFEEAVLRRSSIHLQRAWNEFYEDPALNWRERTGDLPQGESAGVDRRAQARGRASRAARAGIG